MIAQKKGAKDATVFYANLEMLVLLGCGNERSFAPSAMCVLVEKRTRSSAATTTTAGSAQDNTTQHASGQRDSYAQHARSVNSQNNILSWQHRPIESSDFYEFQIEMKIVQTFLCFCGFRTRLWLSGLV